MSCGIRKAIFDKAFGFQFIFCPFFLNPNLLKKEKGSPHWKPLGVHLWSLVMQVEQTWELELMKSPKQHWQGVRMELNWKKTIVYIYCHHQKVLIASKIGPIDRISLWTQTDLLDKIWYLREHSRYCDSPWTIVSSQSENLNNQ